MKKLLSIFLILIASFAVKAQTGTVSLTFVSDTTTNTETSYLAVASAPAINWSYAMGIYVKPINVSGTQTVQAVIQGSPNNTDWYNLINATADSVKINTAGTVKLHAWTFGDSQFKYYRVKCVGYNTGVTRYTGGIILKKEQ